MSTVYEAQAHSFGDLIELVRQGYKTAALPYHEQKDTSVLHLPIYHHWLGLVPEGYVAEIGCGSGYPLAHHIASLWKGTNRKYIGIDLSEEQIEIAKHSLQNDAETVNFTVREMMDWCKKQKDNSLSGIIALFSVFHLPRSQHVELFTQMHRILRDNAPILFTCPEKSVEGFEERWLGASKMYWSSFSYQWYEVTLEDIGFDFVSKSKEIKTFTGQRETTYYLLYTRHPRRKQASRELFYQHLQRQASNNNLTQIPQIVFQLQNQQQGNPPSTPVPSTPMSPPPNFIPFNTSNGDMNLFEIGGLAMSNSLGNIPNMNVSLGSMGNVQLPNNGFGNM